MYGREPPVARKSAPLGGGNQGRPQARSRGDIVLKCGADARISAIGEPKKLDALRRAKNRNPSRDATTVHPPDQGRCGVVARHTAHRNIRPRSTRRCAMSEVLFLRAKPTRGDFPIRRRHLVAIRVVDSSEPEWTRWQAQWAIQSSGILGFGALNGFTDSAARRQRWHQFLVSHRRIGRFARRIGHLVDGQRVEVRIDGSLLRPSSRRLRLAS